MLRKITKIELTAQNYANVTFEDIGTGEESKGSEYIRKGKDIIHDDLMESFRALAIHIATRCDQGSYTEFEDDASKLEIFHCTSVVIGGEDDHQGVMLLGHRNLREGGDMPLKTPFTKFDRNHSTYSYSETLMEAVDKVRSEASLYIDPAILKIRPSAQTHIEDTEEKIADRERHAKRGRKKTKKSDISDLADMGLAVEA